MRLACRVALSRPYFPLGAAWLCTAWLTATPERALAACSTGTSIVCATQATALDSNSVFSSLNNVTVTVSPTASVSVPAVNLGGSAVQLTGNNTTLNNAGVIDPTLSGLASLGGSGVAMGNATAGGTVSVTNASTGAIRGTGLNLVGGLLNLNGLALNLRSNGSGAISINNAGAIGSQVPSGVSLNVYDSPVIAAYGGAPVNMVNTGTVTGRIGFGTSTAGNRFVNAGTVNGSVYLGANSSNTYTAVTGSTVNGGTGVSVDALNVLGLNVGFAGAGLVNGGENGNNTLVLQNAATGTGSGASGTGVASSTVYRNFQNLTVNSGSWTLSGPLVSQQAILNGGLVTVDGGSVFGTGTVQANGGAIAAASNGLTLGNAFTLGAGGLAVQGANSMTLSGALTGTGSLTKSGTGALSLSGTNTYSGGTVLNAGTLTLAAPAALGSGVVTVNGASTLSNSTAMTLSNGIALNNDLTLATPDDLVLGGAITGNAALIKTGAGTLGVTGANSYAGGTQLNGGGLAVAGNTALGSGALTVNAPSTLQASGAAALQNAIVLNGALGLSGANPLALSGAISGAGGLAKTGTGAVTLTGSNSYTGGTSLGGGTVNIGSNSALGSGTITVAAGTTLSSLGNVALANTANLNAALTVDGPNTLSLNGALAGAAGAVVKNGGGVLALNGANSYGGGTTLNAGTLVAGSDTALGTGTLAVGGAATLDSNRAVTLGNAVALGGALTVGGTQALTLNGPVSGAGRLVKNGAANLTLAGNNTNSGGVQLNAGTLTLGSAQGLGSGTLDVGGAATLAAAGLTVGNGIQLGGGSALGVSTGGAATTLAGNVGGAGALALNDGGTLTLSGGNTYTGGTTLNAGRLVLSSDTALGGGALTVAGSAALDTTAARQLANDVNLGATLTVDSANAMTLGGAVTGGGTLVKNGTGVLSLTGTSNGYGGAVINGGVLQASSATLGTNNVTDNARLVFTQNAVGTYAGNISGTGSVDVNGNALLTLSGVNTFTGGLNVLSGAVQTQGGQALADDGLVNIASGAQLRIGDSEAVGGVAGAGSVLIGSGATLALGQDGSDSNFAGQLSGSGSITKTGAGTLVLSGSSDHAGAFAVNGGRLRVDGTLASGSVAVGANAALAGAGTLLGNVNVANGGILEARSGQTLTTGSLALNDASRVNVALGAPQAQPQTLVQVNGNLTLDGQLNVSDTGGFGQGVYRLFGYTGALTDNGLALGDLPPGTIPANLQVQTAISQQVNLVVQNGAGGVQFWNGSKQVPDGTLAGGSGTWQAGLTNWTDAAGQAPLVWGNTFGVFGGASGGNVAVAGQQTLTGLQFFTDGYTLGGAGTLNLAAGTDVIRVDPGLTARIDTAITGSGSLQKRDTGTLILGGSNTYAGGTTLSEGVLQVAADASLGTGALAFDGGTLRVTGDGFTGTNRAISVGSTGQLDIASATNVYTLAQNIAGPGRLTKTGAGTLALSGNNAALAGVDLNAGRLVAGGATSLGAGALNVTGSSALDAAGSLALSNMVDIGAGVTLTNTGSNDLALNGAVTGSGALVKNGGATLALYGPNDYAGGTTLNGGAIQVGSDTALGGGALVVGGASQLIASGARAIDNAITLNAGLSTAGGDMALNGAIAGAGSLTKTGGGTLTLNGTNTYAGGTALQAGTLALGSDAALGTGALAVTGNAELDSSAGARTLSNDVQLAGGNLAVARSQDLTLNGAVSGVGGLALAGSGTTLTLVGANTYTGPTQLNGGNLRLASSAAMGGGALIVAGPASLGGTATGVDLTLGNAVQLDNALTVTGDRNVALTGTLSGTGGLNKGGTAALTLAGANSYAGGTTLQAGNLVLGNDAALGTGALTVAGAAGLSGTQALDVGNAIVLNADLDADTTNDLALGGQISGAGGLHKTGTGTLTLADGNSYAGGTRIDGGTLLLEGGTALGTGGLAVNGGSTLAGSAPIALSNTIQLNAALNVDTTQDVALNGAVSGSGSLDKTGTGTLTVSGGNSYSGGTTTSGGTLLLGADTSLGTGALQVNGAAAIDGTAALTLANGIGLADTLTVNGTQDLDLAGAISGAGGLVKDGAANLTLAGNNSYTGGTTLNGGTLTLGSATALGAVGSAVTVNNNATLSTLGDQSLGNAIALNGTLNAGGADDLTLAGAITGAGALVKQGAGTLTLAGTNAYTGGTQVQGGVLVGDATSLGGPIATALGTQVRFDQIVDGTYAGALTGAGSLEKTGAGALTLSGANNLTGTLGIAGGTIVAQGGQALNGAGLVRVDTGATLRLDDSEAIANLAGTGTVAIQPAASLALGGAADGVFAGDIAGSGALVKTGAGSLALTGVSSHTGATAINQGALIVDGALGSSTLSVANGATLGGSGQATGAVSLADGAHLALDSTRGALTVGSLSLSSNSQLDARLGSASNGGLLNVAGNLTLDGTLNVSDAGGFGTGVYRLINYGGALQNNGLALGSLPAGVDPANLSLLTASAGQVSLLNQRVAGEIQFWDNGATPDDGAITGGTGTWNNANGNWTDATATLDAGWGGRYAVFQGQAGTVTVDGTQNITGLQFSTDGYVIASTGTGQLNAVNDADGYTAIRVEPGLTATITAPIVGAGAVAKRDTGTLILDGVNTYAGGTRLEGGVTQIAADTALGAAGTAVAFDGGTLRIAGTGMPTMDRPVTLEAGGGTFDIADPAETLTLNQGISGTGVLGKTGVGTLALDGANSYTGGTLLQAGTLAVGNDSALGTGTLTASGGTTLSNPAGNSPITLDVPIALQGNLAVDAAASLTLSNAIAGTGGLTKNGGADLTLTGNNSYAGDTRLDAGRIVVGSDTALGAGSLIVAPGTSLDALAPVSLANAVLLNGDLTVAGSNDMTLAGAISGAGGLIKNGGATLTLDGPNTQAGDTRLNAGKLVVGNDAALGGGALIAAAGTTLDSNASIALPNAVQLDGSVAVAGSNDLTLNGAVGGNGALVKNGPAVLTLNGANTYAGGTALNSGTLVVGSNTALGSGALQAADGTTLQSAATVSLANDVVTNGALAVNGAGNLALNGTVSGPGSLDKLGSGTLTLNGANTYTGGTTLQDGTLVLGNANAIGSGTLSVTGPSTLQAGAPLALSNAVALGSQLTVSGANDMQLNGAISGAGSLVKADGATLTLGGTNSYTGGTTLAGGTLVGNTASLQGSIATASGTTLVFDQAGNGVFNGGISGAGQVVKDGGGSVRLNGANSYTGGTTVAAGTLIGDSASLQGVIHNQGTVVFDQNGNGAFNGTIDGNGTLVKNGGATLALNGANTVGGGTTVNSGVLEVNGSLSGGPLTVASGASLSGSGNVSSDVTLANGARLVAGTPLNPISFGGALSLSPATQLDFSLGAPNSATSAVTVATNLTMDGVLNVIDAGALNTGVYRLFQYGGTLTDNGLVYGTLPAGYAAGNFTLQTNQPNQVNLLVESTPGEIQFWNGTKTIADGQIAGGDGTWDGVTANWTNATGAQSQTWNGRFAAFAGTGGTVTVAGPQSLTGMQFLADGYTLQAGANGALDISAPLTPIRVDNGATATIATPITGTGGLLKGDGGTLVLAAANSYGGGTTVAAGTLQVSADNQLGATAGGVTLDGGTLAIAGPAYAGTARNVTLGALGGTIAVGNNDQVFALAQPLTGAGGLTKAGAGTLVLNGASSYGGGTTIAGGTLAGNSTSLQGAINGAAGTTLRFDQDGDGAFNGALSGAGQLVKNGAGALTLTQPSSYTGGTQVNAGTLIGDTTSLQGNIANNANLVFAQNVDGSFNGVLSGNGTVVKNGAGTLTASGVQPFSGTVVVDAGALALGTAASPAVLPALVQVNAGGTLAGSGTIAGLSNAGTVNAGTANGPLRVAGNFQNLPSGTVQVDLTSPGASQVGVQGAATLAGTLRVADGFQYNGTNSYTVLTAAQGVQGQFANTELPQLAFIDASVRYDPNDVLVDFTRNATDFPDLAQTGNESAVAQALQEGAASNANGAGSPLYNAVLGLSSADVPKAFRQLSGDSHAALVSALLNTADTARTTPMHRFNDSLDSDARAAGAVGQGGACVDGPQSGEGGSFFSCRRNVWADVIGNWQHQDGDGNAPSYRQETGGIMVGGDVEVRDGWRVGAAFGYQDSDIKVDSRDARADTDNYSVTLFGGKAFPTRNGQALKVMAGTSFTWSDISTRRDVTLGSASQQLKADYSATTGQVFGEIGYSVPVTPSVTVEPFAGVAYAHQRIHGFSEDGGSAALNADSDSNDITTTTVGVRGGWSTDIAGRAAHLRAALGWRHAMGDVDPERTMAFDTGPSFTVAGTPIARDALVTELGAEVAVSKSATVGLSYRGQHGGGSQDNAGFLNVRWAF